MLIPPFRLRRGAVWPYVNLWSSKNQLITHFLWGDRLVFLILRRECILLFYARRFACVVRVAQEKKSSYAADAQSAYDDSDQFFHVLSRPLFMEWQCYTTFCNNRQGGSVLPASIPLFEHPFPDDRFHFLGEAVIVVGFAGNDKQAAIGKLPRDLYRILQRNHVIRVPVKEQYRPMEAFKGVLHMDGLGYANIIPAQSQPFYHLDFFGNVQRIKGKAQQTALSGAAGNHKGGRTQNQSP